LYPSTTSFAENGDRRLPGATLREDVGDQLVVGLIPTDEAPEPSRSRLALRLDALLRLVGEHDLLLGDDFE
jgi:hypothetical protein